MERITIPVEIVVQGPLITKSSTAGGLGMDAVMARGAFVDSKTGAPVSRYFVPGTLMKGILREAWQELGAVDAGFLDCLPWLGDASGRGRLRISDFVDFGTEPGKNGGQRFRIAMDATRGAAKVGQLQVIESEYAPGKEITFVGSISALGADGGWRAAVERGLLWAESIGGVRSAGFGRVVNVKIGEPRSESLTVKGEAVARRWSYRMSFLGAVIFAQRRIDNNLFESEEVISGGAMKGAVAEMAGTAQEQFGELLGELHAVTFSHAFPVVAGGERPRHWPLSLLVFSKGGGMFHLEDAISQEAAFVRDGEAGAFDIDWKESQEWKEVRGRYGWPKIPTELRVRTAIEGERQQANDGALFAWKMLLPHGLEWMGHVDGSRLSATAAGQLEALLEFGVEPLGKTKARGAVALEHTTTTAVESGELFQVTLETAGLLLIPGEVLASGGEMAMRAAYDAAFDGLSGGELRLESYFQRVSLAGGEYMQHRFKMPSPYRPFLLTNAGSSFLLRAVVGREAEAREVLSKWQATGLPVSQAVLTFHGIGDVAADGLWDRCPYLPENGYGEVRVERLEGGQ